MNRTIHLYQKILRFGIPVLIIFTSIALASSSLINTFPDLAIGITYDLIFTAPLVYFLFIRKTQIPKITIASFVIAGVIIASIIIPENHKFHFNLIISFLIPLLEIIILSTVTYYTFQAMKEFKRSTGKNFDFYKILQDSTVKTIGYQGIGKAISSEIALMYYAFFAWKKIRLEKNEFTYYKETGIIALISTILFLSLLETSIVHLLLTKWNSTVAWALTILSIYGGLLLFSHIKAILRRPHVLKNNYIEFKYGLFGYSAIEYTNIKEIKVSSNSIEDKKFKTHKLALLGELETHNLVIHLKEETSIDIAYGFNKKFNTLLLHVDNCVRFKELVEKKIDDPDSVFEPDLE